MKALHLGAFVHQVTIQSRTAGGVDTSGAPAEPWATLTTAWMARQIVNGGGETFKADQFSGAIVTQWTMRYLDTMDPDQVDVPASRRLLYRGRVYDIVQAELFDRRVGILLRTLAHSAVSA